jgi:formate dehydrogenase major subunit
MHLERRAFLKGTAGVGAAVGLGLFDLSEARAEMRELKIARTTETRSICPYCAVACGVIIHTLGDKAKNVTPAVVHVEGDPDHPTNRGTLCPKGSTLRDDISNPAASDPKVRRPGSDRWEAISWDEAINRSPGTSRTRAIARSWPGMPGDRWSTARRGSRSSAAAPTPTSSTASRTNS